VVYRREWWDLLLDVPIVESDILLVHAPVGALIVGHDGDDGLADSESYFAFSLYIRLAEKPID
jgi:hypothetical protein